MGIVTGRVWIMNRHIRTHSIRYKGIRNKIRQQPFPLCFTQLNRQRNHKFTGQAAVLCFFVFLHSIPQYFSILPFCGSGNRQKNLLPHKALFAGIVMLYPVVLIEQLRTAQIGCSSHGRASGSTADHFCL